MSSKEFIEEEIAQTLQLLELVKHHDNTRLALHYGELLKELYRQLNSTSMQESQLVASGARPSDEDQEKTLPADGSAVAVSPADHNGVIPHDSNFSTSSLSGRDCHVRTLQDSERQVGPFTLSPKYPWQWDPLLKRFTSPHWDNVTWSDRIVAQAASYWHRDTELRFETAFDALEDSLVSLHGFHFYWRNSKYTCDGFEDLDDAQRQLVKDVSRRRMILTSLWIAKECHKKALENKLKPADINGQWAKDAQGKPCYHFTDANIAPRAKRNIEDMVDIYRAIRQGESVCKMLQKAEASQGHPDTSGHSNEA